MATNEKDLLERLRARASSKGAPSPKSTSFSQHFSRFLDRIVKGGPQPRQESAARAHTRSTEATDTLFPLAGGPPRIFTDTRALPHGGFAVPGVEWVNVNAAARGHENVLRHEMGHVADYRDAIPGMDSITEKFYPEVQKRFPQHYAAKNRLEYEAEMFSGAVNILRSGMDPSQVEQSLAEDNYPGLREAVNLLLDQPLYSKHPLRGKLARAQLPAVKARPPKGVR